MTVPIESWSIIRLRRDGRRPLCFTGRLVASCQPADSSQCLTHGLALYRVLPASYAVATETWWAGRPARCRACLFSSLEAALTAIEQHDATQDICPGLTCPDWTKGDAARGQIALAEQSTRLRGLRSDAVRDYGVVAGILLASLAGQTGIISHNRNEIHNSFTIR